ncbi:GTPase Der [Glycine max]|nr:GTPase Der [Glycine max]
MQSTPGIMQSRKSLLQAHIIALVLDAEEIINARRSMKHAEVIIARWAVEEGRGLVVIVNKMNLPRGKHQSSSYEKVMEIVPQEIQTIIPQVKGIPVVFISALEGRGRTTVLNQVIETYEKWCSRLPTARLNRWLQKAISPSIITFCNSQGPATYICCVTQLSDTDIRFLTKSLKENFDLGGIPIRLMQRFVTKKDASGSETRTSKNSHSVGRVIERTVSDKRSVLVE